LFLYPSNQANQRFSGAANRSLEFLVRVIRDKTEAPCQNRLRFHFEQRSPCLAEKLPPLAVMQAAVPFCDLRGNCNRGATNLRLKPNRSSRGNAAENS
jgi:hypothetical protein